MKRARALILPLTVALAPLVNACSIASDDDDTAVDESSVVLEQDALNTSLAELRAGQPYVPGVDETPLAVGEPCIRGAKVSISTGQVVSSAAVVHSRQTLGRELGLDISGTLPVVGGLTGAAGLVVNTKFDSQSAVVLFHTTGTFESVLNGADEIPAFDATNVSRCGYGYVTRATHRLTAALVVSVRATDNSRNVRGSASIGKAGIAEAKASIGSLIQRGRVEISVRFATDVIPNLPSPPLADTVLIVGDSAQEKNKALEKIDRALAWLASAQTTIERHLLEMRSRPNDAPAAPTQSIRFRFYPSTPLAVRTAVERAATNELDARVALAKTNAFLENWKLFDEAARIGKGYEWNVPAAPLATVADLEARKRTLLGPEGKLERHKRSLEESVQACAFELRNDGGRRDAELVTQLGRACRAPGALPLDERSLDIRPIAYVSVADGRGAQRCPAGQRRPLEREAALFGPWSRAIRANDMGIWLEEHGCSFSSGWIYDGAPTCTPTFSSKTGLTICLSSEHGPMPDP